MCKNYSDRYPLETIGYGDRYFLGVQVKDGLEFQIRYCAQKGQSETIENNRFIDIYGENPNSVYRYFDNDILMMRKRPEEKMLLIGDKKETAHGMTLVKLLRSNAPKTVIKDGKKIDSYRAEELESLERETIDYLKTTDDEVSVFLYQYSLAGIKDLIKLIDMHRENIHLDIARRSTEHNKKEDEDSATNIQNHMLGIGDIYSTEAFPDIDYDDETGKEEEVWRDREKITNLRAFDSAFLPGRRPTEGTTRRHKKFVESAGCYYREESPHSHYRLTLTYRIGKTVEISVTTPDIYTVPKDAQDLDAAFKEEALRHHLKMRNNGIYLVTSDNLMKETKVRREAGYVVKGNILTSAEKNLARIRKYYRPSEATKDLEELVKLGVPVPIDSNYFDDDEKYDKFLDEMLIYMHPATLVGYSPENIEPRGTVYVLDKSIDELVAEWMKPEE